MGGFGLAVPALQLSARDTWIGWDGEQRRAYLHYPVNLSRFLIRPRVACRNLASKGMSLSLAALPDDLERQFGYRPWLGQRVSSLAHTFRGPAIGRQTGLRSVRPAGGFDRIVSTSRR
ncbi:MAG: Druantia anti-phage system protein DruA [Methylocella sp.]